MRPIVRGMRRLGVGAKTVWAQQLQAMAVLIFASAALGAGLGAVLYDAVTARVLSETVALNLQRLLICAGIQAILLLLIAAVWAWLAARQKMMQLGSRGKML